MTFFPALFILCALSLAVQDFTIVVPWAYDSYVHITAVVFLVCAINAPFPVMLSLAFFTGFLWDAKNGCIMSNESAMAAAQSLGVTISKAGNTFGVSIFIFALFGCLMHGIRPLFRKRRWTLPILMTGVCLFLMLLAEFLWINLRRGGWEFRRETWMHISATTLMSLAITPLVFLLMKRVAAWCGYDTQFDSLNRPRW